ncbi:alpha/beta hydrolase family protein [Undibacterium sp. Ji67W]|uniref:alpha/beta hydrolase family protein n=1 Tax=Undibacterium sp. Ji67W TaxID=3413042 RepID=UPI003BF37DD3
METNNLIPKVIAHYEKTDVVFFHWVNNKRLVFGVGDRTLGDAEVQTGNGLFAVNKDGSEFRQLIETSAALSSDGSKFRVLNIRHHFSDVSHVENSDSIFVIRNAGTRKTPSATLIKLNTIDGLAEAIPGPANASNFMIDQSGELRIAITSKENLTNVQYRDPQSNQWRSLIEFDPTKESGFTPQLITPDGQLYVNATNGENNSGIYRFDLEKNRLDPTPLISTKDFDFSGNLVYSKKQDKLIGIRYESDAYGTLWLSPYMVELQKTIDAALPNTTNIVSVPSRGENSFALVHAFSDVNPGTYLLFNTKSKKFIPIGDTRPSIDSKAMSYKDFVRIKVRDGMEIPAYLTIPKNTSGKNLPMVVMVHGGPYVRGGHWNWNPETQFLASRGYVVLEPDFRGSTGYGSQLFKAGWKQWGLAMQDDITDATKWAIAQGYADPNRICIAGASYGGYATLMGLIKEPDLYRCGISWVGVTDINYLFDVTWSDTAGTAWSRYGMPAMVGDQVKDAEQFKATSPVVQAQRLKRPLILAYGAADVRVPVVHGERFLKAAPDTAKIEWITYAEEGHGWRKLKNNVDFWTRVEKFLQENTAPK